MEISKKSSNDGQNEEKSTKNIHFFKKEDKIIAPSTNNVKQMDKAKSENIDNNFQDSSMTLTEFKKQFKFLLVKSAANGNLNGKAQNPNVLVIREEVKKMNGLDSDNKSIELDKPKKSKSRGKFFAGKSIVAVFLAFIITVLVVASVVTAGNVSADNAVTANVTNTRVVQAKLSSLGYFEGEINGIYNKETIEAIKNFQADKNLAATGSLDSATTVALGVTNNAQANTDLYLLAKLIYSEARGEVYEGQVAVAAVVLNRVADAGFPNTLQGVIYQPWAFTALHDGQFALEPNSTAYQAAQDAMNGWDPTYGCLYYYNPRTATSSWIFSRQIIVTIGNHVFCV